MLRINNPYMFSRVRITGYKIAPSQTLRIQSRFHFHTHSVRLNDKRHKNSQNNDVNDHDHIHLMQSETEKNDSFVPNGERHAMHLQTVQHKHTHSHTESNPLLVLSLKEIKQNPGVRITWIGLGSNVAIAAGKFVGGIVFHSQALLADSIHALSDLVSDVLTLFSVGLSSGSATKEFPYGQGKIETVGSLAVSTILAMAGVSIGWGSLCAIVGPIIPHTIVEMVAGLMSSHSHSHTHGTIEGVTNINAAWIAAGSIVVKEWIFQATKSIAIKTNSNVLMANAWHHRVDSLTSFVALIAITSSYFFNVQCLDDIGGLIVSALIIKTGGEGMVQSIKELIDQSVPHNDPRYIQVENLLNDSLKKLVSNNNSDKPYEVKELIVLSSGPNLRLSTVLKVPTQKWDNTLTIKEAENVSQYLRNIVKKNITNMKKVEVEFISDINNTSNKADYSHAHKHTHIQK